MFCLVFLYVIFLFIQLFGAYSDNNCYYERMHFRLALLARMACPTWLTVQKHILLDELETKRGEMHAYIHTFGQTSHCQIHTTTLFSLLGGEREGRRRREREREGERGNE